MMIGVTKWPYDQASIDKRQADCDWYGDPSDNCKNEDWFIRELSQQLEDKFGITRNFTFAFMDSYSQAGPAQNDAVQQEHWLEETNKLWTEATIRNGTFDFQTIDDVLEDNALCKEENQRYKDIIDVEIASIKEDLANNTKHIADNSDEILRVSTTLTENIDEVYRVLTDEINELSGNLSIAEVLPVGTILAWTMKVEVNGPYSKEIPEGWLRCDGSIIPAPSVWAGQKTPDLNNDKRFLRGGTQKLFLKNTIMSVLGNRSRIQYNT